MKFQWSVAVIQSQLQYSCVETKKKLIEKEKQFRNHTELNHCKTRHNRERPQKTGTKGHSTESKRSLTGSKRHTTGSKRDTTRSYAILRWFFSFRSGIFCFAPVFSFGLASHPTPLKNGSQIPESGTIPHNLMPFVVSGRIFAKGYWLPAPAQRQTFRPPKL